MRIPVRFSSEFPIEIKKQGKWFISSCSSLDLYSQGRTRKSATENLAEAIRLFLESCLERGTLQSLLQQVGPKETK